MLLPFIQTLACLSLINGGLYALHLTGSGSGGSGSSSAAASSSNANNNNNNNNIVHNSNNLLLTGSQQPHSSHPPGGGRDPGLLNVHQQQQPQQQQLLYSHPRPHPHASFGGLTPLDSAGRLGQELADIAQLEREQRERERLMVELAKQPASGGAATGRRGQPIVTGRIHMTPAEDPGADDEYPASMLLQQAARSFMFGNVVKQPRRYEGDEYEDSGEDYGAEPPRRYEYGRVVQPVELPEAPLHPHPLPHHQQQHLQLQQQQHPPRQQHPFDPRRYHHLDGFELDLDAEPDVEDDALPDLDGYQYLDELLAEQQQQLLHDGGWHHLPQQQEQQDPQPPFYQQAGDRPQNPFHGFEELESNPSQTLQDLFGHQHQHEDEAGASTKHVGGSGSGSNPRNRQPFDVRLQQKWQRKRAQQQQKFLSHKKLQQHLGLQQQQQHFGQQQLHNGNNKMTLESVLSAEAAATSKQHQQQQHSSATSSSKLPQAEQTPTASASSQGGATDPSSKAAAAAAATADNSAGGATNANNNQLNQQQQPPQQQSLLHPNHKRSGIGAGASGASSYSSMHPPPPPPVTHSIANQLMLRTARGQRQYDVPQIECPNAMDGMERFACPTPDVQGRYRCIDDHVLCDGFIDCPEGEDEDRRSCMFYKTTKAHLDVLADALLRWARGR